MSMLAERKRKTKWVITPTKRPLWETGSDRLKFGKELMEKMGWSIGKGLGVNEQGIQEPLKVSYKNDTKGIGFRGNDDDWIEQQDEFNNLLNQLRNNSDSYIKEIPEKEKEIKSLEEKSKKSKARVHYQKFTRSKDLSRYSDNDLACIFGTTKMKKEKLKTEETIQTESKVLGNYETSFGITTINSGSIQDYFRKKWIFDKKLNNSCDKNKDDIDIMNVNHSDAKLYFVKNEWSLASESEERRFKKRKCKSNFEEKCLQINGNNTSEVDEWECLEKNIKRKKLRKDIQGINSKEFRIKNIKKNCEEGNVLADENLQKHKTCLIDNLHYEESENLINNEITYCDSMKKRKKEKNNLISNVLEDEKNHSFAAGNKKKQIYESCVLGISSSEKLNETNEKEFNLEVEMTERRKKKKLQKENLKEMDEMNNEEFCYASKVPLGRQSDAVSKFCIEINLVKKRKKQKKEKFLNDRGIENKYCKSDKNDSFNNCSEEQINETIGRDNILGTNSVEKSKRKKYKKEKLEEERRNHSIDLLEKENLREESNEKNINSNIKENVEKIIKKKRKKDKIAKLNEKEKIGVGFLYDNIEKSILEEKFKETSVSKNFIDTEGQKNKLQIESYQREKKKKHKKEKKKKEDREKEKEENINCCTDHIDGFNGEIVNTFAVENTLGVELIKKKKKRKKDEAEKLDGKEKADVNYHYDCNGKPISEEIIGEININEVCMDSTETESVPKKNNEKEKSKENTENENTEESCECKQRENKEKEQKLEKIKDLNREMTDKKIPQENENNVFYRMTNDQVEEGKGVHKHKMELLNEKRMDKFYPGQHTVARVLRLIYWSDIAGFKGSNLETVTGYGFLKKCKSNKSGILAYQSGNQA